MSFKCCLNFVRPSSSAIVFKKSSRSCYAYTTDTYFDASQKSTRHFSHKNFKPKLASPEFVLASYVLTKQRVCVCVAGKRTNNETQGRWHRNIHKELTKWLLIEYTRHLEHVHISSQLKVSSKGTRFYFASRTSHSCLYLPLKESLVKLPPCECDP